MNKRETEILNQFNELKPHLNTWGSFIDNTLIKDVLPDLIDNHLIKILPNYRLKDDRSYLFKSLYRKKDYTEPIENIEDKIGTRIVVLKSDDIRIVQERILQHPTWTSKLTKNIDQEIEDKPNIFDYQSSHIVVRPTKDNKDFPIDIINLLSCEIQIRTLLQHAFAEISHDSTYKGPYKNDKEILRRLAKAMALMEATDDYFCNIFSLMSDEQRFYSSYQNELIQIYKQFNNTFDKKELDINVSDSILELLELKAIPVQEIEGFVAKYESDIIKYIKPQNGLIFQQPIILLILYYFFNHRTFLNEYWPLNLQVLKSIYKATNTSFEEY